MACRYGYLRDGNGFKQYSSTTGAETGPNGSGNYYYDSGSEIGKAPDRIVTLQNTVVQPELRYQGFIYYGPYVTGNCMEKD